MVALVCRQIAALDSGSTPQRAAPSHSMQTRQGMSPEDAAMAERLARLKADRVKNGTFKIEPNYNTKQQAPDSKWTKNHWLIETRVEKFVIYV